MSVDLAEDDALADDRIWDRVWERMLGPVERHGIAVAVWRRRIPTDLFDARVAGELARRWRRRALNLAVVYALWTLFWGAIALSDWRTDGDWESSLSPVLTWLGLLAVACCFGVRRRLAAYARRAFPLVVPPAPE